MFRRVTTALAVAFGLAAVAHAQTSSQSAQPAPAMAPAPQAAVQPAAPNDYSDPGTWLCRPGREDACTSNLDSTVIRADGHMTLHRYQAAKTPPIDCFYVYPTVSRDPGVNATMKIEPAETSVAVVQFARFGAKCRLFAPMYRQFTLTALNARMLGRPMGGGGGDPTMAYNDVRDAWNEYLAHDNHGRGVVLIGHSQGSGMLTLLIAREIDGKPIQQRIVSAILMGASLQIPPGKDVGGSFKSMPVCRSARQLHCVIAFADFRADSPPPDNSRFGKGRAAQGTVAACANPGALGGGSAPMHAYFTPRNGNLGDDIAHPVYGWTNPPQPLSTPFVEAPGLVTGQCVSDAHGTYLAVTLHPTPGGKRANQIAGDVVVAGVVQKDWGLHLLDADLNMGALLDVVGAETRAYLARGGK